MHTFVGYIYLSGNSNHNPSTQYKAEYGISNEAAVVDVNDDDAVTKYLLSKKFKNDGMTIKFEPGGYYQLSKNYEVVLTGTWRTGSKKYDNSIMLYLTSQASNLTLMLSDDGKIMDKASLRVFQ